MYATTTTIDAQAAAGLLAFLLITLAVLVALPLVLPAARALIALGRIAYRVPARVAAASRRRQLIHPIGLERFSTRSGARRYYARHFGAPEAAIRVACLVTVAEHGPTYRPDLARQTRRLTDDLRRQRIADAHARQVIHGAARLLRADLPA